MAGNCEYTVRRHALEKQRIWRINDAGLSWHAADKAGQFKFTDISDIRFEWIASRADLNRYACHVMRANGWTESIVSTSYDGPMQFPDQRATYLPFVRTLVQRTAAANPACRFHAGSSRPKFFGNLTVAIASLAFLALMGIGIGIPLTGLIVAKFVVLGALFPLAMAWIKKNRPRRFAPSDIPADVIPASR